jgi:hypothetical protein
MTLPALALAAALVQQDAYALKWQPKRGETHVYELFLSDKETSVEASVEHKVADVKPDGSYTVQSRSLGALVRLAGSEFRDDRPNEASASFDAYGRLIEVKDRTTGLEKVRNALLTRFVAPPVPVKPGDKWSCEREKDRPAGLAAVSVEYTFKSVKDGVAEVGFTFLEKGGQFPQSATGTWWVDTKSGLPQRFEAKVKNFVGQEGPDTDVKIALRKPL